jgi:hypothetical protein
MHGPVELDAEGKLQGMSGRTIIANSLWNNPTGKFYVGIKVSIDYCRCLFMMSV